MLRADGPAGPEVSVVMLCPGTAKRSSHSPYSSRGERGGVQRCDRHGRLMPVIRRQPRGRILDNPCAHPSADVEPSQGLAASVIAMAWQVSHSHNACSRCPPCKVTPALVRLVGKMRAAENRPAHVGKMCMPPSSVPHEISRGYFPLSTSPNLPVERIQSLASSNSVSRR